MREVGILAWSTLYEQWRNRVYQLAMLFGGLMIYLSLLLGMLAVDQERRALLDCGLSLIELLALATAIYGAATGVLREMETKSIYLILTRPVTRWRYLLGRTAGLALSMAAATVLMAALHVALLAARGWAWQSGYAVAIAGILLKVAVATALAGLFALVSTSSLSALVMTGIVWTLGHFLPEMRFLAQRGNFPVVPLLLMMRVLPNLQVFNFRDRLDVPARVAAGAPLALAVAYAAAYVAACLVLSYALFRRRDL